MSIYNRAQEKITNLYAGDGWRSLFVKIRFWDAPFREIVALVPKTGTVVDLGCGDGILANLISLVNTKSKVIGIEKNSMRIGSAYKGLSNTKFINGDITSSRIPSADCILLIHVLHHLSSREEQIKLISDCHDKLKKNGIFIIAEIQPEVSLKFLITWFTDHFLVACLFDHQIYSKIFFRKGKEWASLLKSQGFEVSLSDVSRGKPFSHIVLNCRKK